MKEHTKKFPDVSDIELLQRLLDSDLLAESESKAFNDMLGRLERGTFDGLTGPQRKWAEDVYDKHDLQSQEGAKNLISSGKYVPTQAELEKRYSWELMPKPLKPPGR